MNRRALRGIFLVVVLALLAATAHAEEESVCAEVKIEIAQELTMERQAFEATMRIANTLDGVALEDIEITVNLEDENGDPVVATSDTNSDSADFFVRLDDSRGVESMATGDAGAVTNGVIPADGEGQLRWLMIPTAGAGGDGDEGKLFFVGATLDLTYAGKAKTLEAAPDSIRVKPQPTLVLDYFLPQEVHGDNPMTTEVEPVEPYTLGVRVANTGSGAAHNLQIESAQPEIVENEQGLLVDFEITDSYIDEESAKRTLLLDFGTIAGEENRMGRWVMESTLSGEFVDFDARMTHAEEYGGALTSLIDDVYTRTLVSDVLVNQPGRDQVRDYLARVGKQLRVFESEATGQETMDCIDCAPVNDITGSLGAGESTPNGVRHSLSVADSDEFVHVRVPDPYQGKRPLKRATRGDGSLLQGANMWQSKSLKDDNVSYDHYVHVFDAKPANDYELVFGTESEENLPPEIAYITDYTTHETAQVGFLVQASDPNGTEVSLEAQDLPSGAEFTDRGDGQGVFHWVPEVGQAGDYEVGFEASDGALSAVRTTTITVNPEDDPDGENGDDGSDGDDGDSDDGSDDGSGGDGGGTDPITNAPAAVQIVAPVHDATVGAAPALELRSTDYDPDQMVTYTIEVYSDRAMTEQVLRLDEIMEEGETTTVTLDEQSLEPGATYFWRVKADTPVAGTEWVYSRFTVAASEDSPRPFSIHSPREGITVDTRRPTLAVDNARYGDNADVTYDFQVYYADDDDFSDPVAETEGIPAGSEGVTDWTLSSDLSDGQEYYWVAIANTSAGQSSVGEAGNFSVDLSHARPTVPELVAPATDDVSDSRQPSLVAQGASSPSGASLVYRFELLDGQGSVLQQSEVTPSNGEASWQPDALADNASYRWRVRASDDQTDSPVAEGAFDVVTGDTALEVPTPANPANDAWIQVLQPTLWVKEVAYPDGVGVSYEFELYSDEEATDRVAETVRQEPTWPLSFELSNHSSYYWRVRTVTDKGDSEWSVLQPFFVNQGGGNVPPEMEFQRPDQDLVRQGGEVAIRWLAHDPDSEAEITLFHSEDQVIASGLPETMDGGAGEYLWNIDDLEPGEYTISALIEDDEHQVTVENCCVVSKRAADVGVVVEPVNEMVTDEWGMETAEVDVSLESAPFSGESVVLGLSVSDETAGEIQGDQEYLEFTADNWSEPQRVTLRGRNDCRAHGDRNYFLRFAQTASGDAGFDGLVTPSVAITNRDRAQADQEFFICDYDTVRKETVEPGVVEHEIRPSLVNRGRGISAAEATLTLRQSDITLVDGQSQTFAGTGNGGTVAANDTLTLRYPEDDPALLRALEWSVNAERPEIDSEPEALAEVGGAYEYQVQAAGGTDDTFSYQVLNGPEGLSVDPETGLISWEPGESQMGVHQVVVEVTDQDGGVVRQTYTLDVRPEGMGDVEMIVVDTNPDSSAHFHSLHEAAQSLQGTTLDRPVVIYARASSGLPDTHRVELSGIGTTADNNITIVLQDGYRLAIQAGGNRFRGVYLHGVDVHLRGDGGRIQIDANGMDYVTAIRGTPYESQPVQIVEGLVIEGVNGTSVQAFTGIKTGNGGEAVVRNNLIRGFDGAGIVSRTDAYIYNNTLVENGTGLLAWGDATAINNIAQNNARADYKRGFSYSDSGWTDTAGNLSEDDTSPDSGFRERNVNFKEPEAGDYQLLPWDENAMGQGVDLSQAGQYPFDTYLTGAPRTGAWHLGALPVGSATNRPPEITSEPPAYAEASEDALYEYAVKAQDPDSDELVFELVESPSGMRINPETGLLQWERGELQVGEYGITIEVRDAHNGIARQEFSLVVSPEGYAGMRVVNVDTNPEADADYTSLAQAVAGEQGSLSEPLVFRLRASSGVADTSRVVIAGFETTQDKPVYVVFESGYTLDYAAKAQSDDAIEVRSRHVRLIGEGGVIRVANKGYEDIMAIDAEPSDSDAVHYYKNLRLAGDYSGAPYSSGGLRTSNQGQYVIQNNVIHGFTGAYTSAGLRLEGNGAVYNNTLVNNTIGLFYQTDSARVFNNLVAYNEGVDFQEYYGTWTEHGNNLSTDGSSPDPDFRNLSVLFVAEDQHDYRLSPEDSVAAGAGLDLSDAPEFPLETDATGAVRTAPWNIGALPLKQ
ncbi:hypothetical protein DES49_2588 [Halospina denitrificans]|uniref:Uncharacterized protein n=1 Tax=Halospina denitrificans TaxID=332522 RepID=A0A4R7JLF7_9GAMM|nr:putative Ig domain-containing protein [Halospina denitrificans]TDT38605.1 hypothetical protein DES49_2588 [Halospina denitrificans]